MVKRAAAAAQQIGISRRALEALGIGTVLAGLLFVAAGEASPEVGFWYLSWNLVLGYIPLVLTFPLVAALQTKKAPGWQAAVWALLWLMWLPNSFYVLTDVAHLMENTYGLDPLLGVALFGLFAGLGMAAGFMSLLAVHRAARRRWGGGAGYLGAELVLLVCSVGIYAGRTLRWNSWDLVLHPAALAEGVWNGAVQQTGTAVGTTTLFFVLLSGLYAALWRVFGEAK